MSQPRSANLSNTDYPKSIQRDLSPFQNARRGKSIWQLCNTLIPYVSLWIISAWALSYSIWLALPALILAGGFTIRTFILFHDCGHQSFFRSRRANDFWGRITGVLTFTPYHYWHASHARHHATSGNLDKRGFGDVWMMTVDEYMESSVSLRLKYRLYRHPVVMFIFGPLFLLLVSHRLVRAGSTTRERNSVWLTNIAVLAIAAALVFLLGWESYLIIQFGSLFLALVGGLWLFYVQHQFEGVYWERDDDWDFVSASLDGGSFYKLPRVLAWFTGNIGYHHVHHLNARIPNYNLPLCHRDTPGLQKIRPVKFFGSFKSLRFRLWDEHHRRMVGFGHVKSRRTDSSVAN